ncbi:MAG TPA: hypothetical protein VJ891_12850 [Casimicrobiaceae bacterium]|nr:hypothetical protein [Casimicrobiaceae bacterium]
MAASSFPRSVDAANARVRLHALGAGAFAHVNGTLEAHLLGTERLLRGFRNDEAVCLAGLYHAVYGTDGITGTLLAPADEERRSIAALIGDEAESLAWLYGACDRERFHPRIGTPSQHLFADRFSNANYWIDDVQLCAFCEITVANEVELAHANSRFAARHARRLAELFARMRPLVSEAAYAMAREIFGEPVERGT